MKDDWRRNLTIELILPFKTPLHSRPPLNFTRIRLSRYLFKSTMFSFLRPILSAIWRIKSQKISIDVCVYFFIRIVILFFFFFTFFRNMSKKPTRITNKKIACVFFYATNWYGIGSTICALLPCVRTKCCFRGPSG